MQEFLVQIDIRLPPDLEPAATAALQSAEFRRGRELVEQRTIRHIWRVPGRRANVGVWRADDATELHRLLVSLPMFPYMDIRVTPLAIHGLDGKDASEVDEPDASDDGRARSGQR